MESTEEAPMSDHVTHHPVPAENPFWGVPQLLALAAVTLGAAFTVIFVISG